MERVVVLGRGGAGKSVFAERLGRALGLPVVELDARFWTDGLAPMAKDRWAEVQRGLAGEPRWILDGDLGPYDVLEIRLAEADTVIVLDFPLWLCAWRALRRSRENLAFWRWVLSYRRSGLPVVMAAVARHAGRAEVHVLRGRGDVERFFREDGPLRS
ncbi:hypothetical protein [Actinocorallia longicatena]|uniref:ATPase AAA n=1 Tax=Actinocorallia longicatena TaxID=111803 RepID=A0ABP6QAZ8_9ACTN